MSVGFIVRQTVSNGTCVLVMMYCHVVFLFVTLIFTSIQFLSYYIVFCIQSNSVITS
jgi:hypothetical protein